MPPFCIHIDEVTGHPVGGKAEGLARLRRLGLRVPDAVVVVGARPTVLPADRHDRVAALGDGPFAVRSSALGEDGETTSFAGQYETVLGVSGREALDEALERCLASAQNDRSRAYRRERDDGEMDVPMSIVVQRMVDATVSGVCFTVDPVTSRRNRLVIDSTAGLGEALVSGAATPDHDELRRGRGDWDPTDLAGEHPLLSATMRERIAAEALRAEDLAGQPLDLEWAVDRDETLYWLQARPITTLARDPQDLDTRPDDPTDVFTRCNVGEMMPGAVSPLTFSTCARGIDVGWQDNMIEIGVRERREPHNVYIGMSHGHLFINLSEGARFASAVTGSHPDQQSLAICGRLVPEVAVPPETPLRTRLPRAWRQIRTVLRPRHHLERMEALLRDGDIPVGATARETWHNVDAALEGLYEAYARHLTVSSGAGALAPILLRILAGDAEPTDRHHAAVAHVLSGADDVESADIAIGARRILEALRENSEAATRFANQPTAEARSWIESHQSGDAGQMYRDYLERHGHRSLRELDVRQPEWAHDPTPLISSLQAQLRADARGDGKPGPAPANRASNTEPDDARKLRWATRIAHAAVRNRERGKSLLVGLTVRFKRAYRALAAQLVAEGRLPDEDAVFFLLHEELGELAGGGAEGEREALSRLAVERRDALAWQETQAFPEVSVGLPEPEVATAPPADDDVVVGKPVSRGIAEGPVRVVRDLAGAESLQPGEILVAGITDVGWTPYFAIIAGLVTDVGSAVSHGAVVAREYGLPAVLNTRVGTRVLETGDRVRLDGDRGTVEILERPSREQP